MTRTKVGINGFGRIGRGVLRALLERPDTDMEIVAINDLAPAANIAHLLKYDSVHGRLRADVKVENDSLCINGSKIRLTAERDPANLPWSDVDLAMECTGLFTTREKAALHLQNGSGRVLVSAPAAGADKTVVYGVNHHEISIDDRIISNASCTTNCLAPVAFVLDQAFGIETGYMTTVHAYTGDQPTHDSNHKDLYRARGAALSMIPTSTGAARALSEVLPNLKGRLEGSAIRVPTPNVSLVDLSFLPKSRCTAEDVNEAIRKASEGTLNGVLSFETDPLVSIDFNHDPHSSCFAAAQTAVTDGGLVRVVSWYDNEWGFANRMVDTGSYIGSLGRAEKKAA